MRVLCTLLATFVAITGCGTTNHVAKVDNPVMGDAPPRKVTAALDPLYPGNTNKWQPTKSDVSPATQEVNLASGNRQDIPVDDMSEFQVVAQVNGEPVLAYEVLDPYAKRLSELRETVSPQEYRAFRNSLIKNDLRLHIERKLVYQSLKATLKPEQFKQLNQHVELQFEKRIAELKKEFQVNTKLELEHELQEQGTSISALRHQFVNQQVAREYLAAKAQSSHTIGRQELIEYYRAHLDDYTVPAQVKWDQVVVSHAKHGGKPDAFQIFENVVEDLKRGTAFNEVAKLYSDGPTASNGGQWNWTRAGSLANKDLEKTLFQLPIGTISQPLDGQNAFQLIRITDRQDAGRIPFEEVQDEIVKTMQQQDRQNTVKNLLEQLIEPADVITIFDEK